MYTDTEETSYFPMFYPKCDYCERYATTVTYTTEQCYQATLTPHGEPDDTHYTAIGLPERAGDYAYYCAEHADMITNDLEK